MNTCLICRAPTTTLTVCETCQTDVTRLAEQKQHQAPVIKKFEPSGRTLRKLGTKVSGESWIEAAIRDKHIHRYISNVNEDMNNYVELDSRDQVSKKDAKNLSADATRKRQIDITGEWRGKPIAIMYDGNKWHKNTRTGDNRVSAALVNKGFIVLRLRERPLKSLLPQRGVYQYPFKWTSKHKEIYEQLERIFQKFEAEYKPL